MKRIFSLLMVLLLSLSACGGQQKWEIPEGPLVWFVSDEPALWSQVAEGESIHGPALAAETYEGDMNAEALVTALLSGPEGEGLRSPFPKGLSVREIVWDEEMPGNLQVRLSEQYGALADISLTLADYCIVLTLSQLEEVETVEILSQGYSASYRSHHQLSSDEVMLWDSLAEPAGSS